MSETAVKSEREKREEALARDLDRVDCALARLICEDDTYVVLHGEAGIRRPPLRSGDSASEYAMQGLVSFHTLSEAEEWCRNEVAIWIEAGA